MDEGALTGLRVLDLSQMLAGPLCGMRLGDLGAEVLKIEPPGQGEWTRTHSFANASLEGETTAVLGLNRNKRSVTVNLKHAEGLKTFYELVRESDIFVQNFRVGTAERLGVSYEQLREINPRIIYCSISGYGEHGPYSGRPGQDLVVQGYSGSMWSVGSKNDPPLPGALWAIDAMTAYQAAIGILAALWARARTGCGQKVTVNMLAVAMDCQAQELTTHLNLNILPERSAAPFAHAWVTAPYGVYRTADGYLTLAQVPLHLLGEALDNNRLREMSAWEDGILYRDEVYAIVSEILPERTTAEWLAIFDQRKIWAGPVYTYADLATDPHVIETGMIAEVAHPTIGTLRMPNIPLALSETPATIRLAPPLLGEHTDEVLRELLGYSDARLAELHAHGAI